MPQPTTIIADSVLYFHENDETAFFEWLDRMEAVAGYEGVGTAVHIRLARTLTDDDLRELLAFHERYNIDMGQLAAFLTPKNAEWFAAPNMYWHVGVFGSGMS
jgi:hypothetical protein